MSCAPCTEAGFLRLLWKCSVIGELIDLAFGVLSRAADVPQSRQERARGSRSRTAQGLELRLQSRSQSCAKTKLASIFDKRRPSLE